MAAIIDLLIFDPRTGAMVRARYLGGNATKEKAMQTRSLDSKASEGDCWSTTPCTAAEIAQFSYHQGAMPDEINRLALKYPSPDYWWMIDCY